MTERSETGGRPGANRRWFAIGAVAIAIGAIVALSVGGIGDNLVYYWGPTEVVEAGPKAIGASIRLGGQVAEGTIESGSGSSAVAFMVTDGRNDIRVVSRSVPPQMFREGIGVVVEGTMTAAGVFESDRLMVSHGNEYRAPGEGETVDPERLIRSTSELADGR